MKYTPTENEIVSFSTMSEDEQVNYCLVRMIEAEEVWGLTESEGWVMSENGEHIALPIWPYKTFAVACKTNEWENAEPEAISLEHFVYKVSQMLIDNQILVEIAPTTKPGRVMEPKPFFKMLENLMESGEYFMEG